MDTTDIILQANVPIFEGGLISSRVREAKEKSKKSAQNVEKQKRAVVREVNASYDGIRSSMTRAQALKKSVESQSILLEAKERGYRSGLYTSLAVLDAARTLHVPQGLCPEPVRICHEYSAPQAGGRYPYGS